MNYNILNGGLVLSSSHDIMMSHLRNQTTEILKKNHGFFWFMNTDGGFLYYSDQSNGNRLFKMNLIHGTVDLLVDQPCYGLCLIQEMLYFLSEVDQHLYSCDLSGKHLSCLLDEKIKGFVVDKNQIVYSTTQGIFQLDRANAKKIRLTQSTSAVMLQMENKLFFSDSTNQYQLTQLDYDTNTTKIYQDIVPAALNTDGRYLFCINRKNGNSIYRIDINEGLAFRISAENSDYLHIIDEDLYFCVDQKWHKMSISGGQSLKLESE